jgi:uncharacterized protein (DUF433 family)
LNVYERQSITQSPDPWSKLAVEVTKELFDRISIDPAICHGQACVKGTRIPVHQIVRMVANGDTVEDLLAEYPTLSCADIRACLDYAAELAEEQVKPIPATTSER